jgi:uroporphyrinogen III methyltransferase / synthase
MSRLRVVVTRSSVQASRLSSKLREHEFEPVEVPLIEVRQSTTQQAAIDAAIDQIESFEWVAFTSPNAVDVSLRHRPGRETGSRGLPRIAAVGPGTAERVRQYQVEPSMVAETSSGQGLVAAMASIPPSTVLVPQAAGARPDVVDGLRALGWTVTPCVSYETVAVRPSGEVLAAASACDVIAFASSSAVEAWAAAWVGSSEALPAVTPNIVVSIGPQTTATAIAHGLAVTAESDPHTLDGLVAAVASATARLLG